MWLFLLLWLGHPISILTIGVALHLRLDEAPHDAALILPKVPAELILACGVPRVIKDSAIPDFDDLPRSLAQVFRLGTSQPL